MDFNDTPGQAEFRAEARLWLADYAPRYTNPRGRRFNSVIASPGVVLAAGQTDGDAPGAFLAAIDAKDGSELWSEALPAAPVKGGTAVDHRGRIIVSLTDGQVLCFGASDKE